MKNKEETLDTKPLSEDGQDISRRFLVDPYENWARGEGIPIHLDFGHNLLALETGRWDRWDHWDRWDRWDLLRQHKDHSRR